MFPTLPPRSQARPSRPCRSSTRSSRSSAPTAPTSSSRRSPRSCTGGFPCLNSIRSFHFVRFALHQPTNPTTNLPPNPHHRYREFTTWTDLNTILYHGSAEDRAESRATEWWFDEGVLDSFLDAAGQGKRGGAGKKLLPKFQVGMGDLVVGSEVGMLLFGSRVLIFVAITRYICIGAHHDPGDDPRAGRPPARQAPLGGMHVV